MNGRMYSFDVNSMYPEVIRMTEKRGKLYSRKGYKEEWVVYLPISQNKEIIDWCREVFGEPGRDRKYLWRANWAEQSNNYPTKNHGPRIFLHREADVTMLMLKWSGNGQ